MLEVHSPIPMTEGETLVFGIRTKHIAHFSIGVCLMAPMAGVLWFLLPLLHQPRFLALMVWAGVGVVFAMVPVSNRPLAEWLWLSFRYWRRPKIVLYDREHRVRVHRKRESERWEAS
ncbi:hypothetical protein [Alicyclobacillus hesperidum]|nr:hypothetical protein [Alicyclobacillus hesperidum]